VGLEIHAEVSRRGRSGPVLEQHALQVLFNGRTQVNRRLSASGACWSGSRAPPLPDRGGGFLHRRRQRPSGSITVERLRSFSCIHSNEAVCQRRLLELQGSNHLNPKIGYLNFTEFRFVV